MDEEYNYDKRHQKRIEEEEEVACVKQKMEIDEQEIFERKQKKKAALHIGLELVGLCGIIVIAVGSTLGNLVIQIIGGMIAGGFFGISAIILIIDSLEIEKVKRGGRKLSANEHISGIFAIFTFLVMICGFVMIAIGEGPETTFNGVTYKNRTDSYYWGAGIVCVCFGVFLLIAIVPIIFSKLTTGISSQKKALFDESAIEDEARVVFVKRAMEMNSIIYNYIRLEFNDGRKVTLLVKEQSYKKDAMLTVRYLPNKYKRCIILDCEKNREQQIPAQYEC